MSFRQFGGLNYAPKHNIVGSNYNTSNNLSITKNFGQPNSYINFQSDISGNILIYGNLTVEYSISANNIYVNDISANNIVVYDISSNSILVYDISANNINVNDISVNDINVNDISANNIVVNDISANNILVYDISANYITADNIVFKGVYIYNLDVDNLTGNIINTNSLNIINDLSGNTANFSDSVTVDSLNIINDLSGNTANFSDSVTVDSLTVTNDLSGNTANFSGIITVDSLTVTNDLSCNTANFSGLVTASSFNSTSDYRIKEDVIGLNSLFVVDNLNPITYTNSLTKKKDMGFIAHEVQNQFPFLVNGEKDGEILQSINYIGIIALLVKEIQDLKHEIKEIKQKLNK